MKKLLSGILLICFLCLTGCVAASVNDPATGEITDHANRYTYIDGVYLAYATYYNHDGYLPAMQLTVQNGVVIQVYFDLFDTSGNRYSQSTSVDLSEEVSLFNNEIKSLNSTLLQTQTYTDLNQDTDTSSLYREFASALFPRLIAGDTNPYPLDLTISYSASGTINSYGYYPILTVIYDGPSLISISFSQLDAQNNNIADLKAYTELYLQKNSLAYEDALPLFEALPSDNITLTKASATGLDKDLLLTYNKLAVAVSAKHTPFQSSPESLFSSK